MSCVSADTLQRFLDGTLPDERLAAVEAHVESCPLCRELVAEATDAAFPREGAAAVDDGPPPPGQLGRYQLEEPIGAGGTGVVYAAHDPQLHRRVAIKLLQQPHSASAREALLHEARAMARVAHANVLPVFEVGELPGQVFLVMELAEGGCLRDWLQRERRTADAIVDLFLGAARGLAAAHEAGLVHRDFKPANVLLARDGRAQVTDFGLARALHRTAPAQAPQQLALAALATAPAGTPAYMAPEQMRGEPADARADVFSFCVALHEALCGERPFAGATALQLLREIEAGHVRPPPPASQLTEPLREVLARGLRAEPAQRYATMRALIAALQHARRAKARRLSWAAAAASALLAAALLFIVLRQEQKLAALAQEKVQLDTRIGQVLAQLQDERDPARLAALDAQLDALSLGAERAALGLRGRGAPALRESAPVPSAGAAVSTPELDAQLRALLRRLGADTYAVPPGFRERIRLHVERLLRRKSLAAEWQRKRQYWPRIAPGLAARGLPVELGYLAWQESGFDPQAKSPAGSLGVWQLMPETARRYGLRVDAAVDERTDVERSTQAAAAYLTDLLAEFGTESFMLALASYNMGEEGMRAALHKLAQEPGGFRSDRRDFWHLYLRKLLSDETSDYVPQVLAAALVGTNPKRYGLE